MRYKTMKKSGEKISAITVGTWAIGGKNSMGAAATARLTIRSPSRRSGQ